jgi:hypothetical protein
VDGAPTRKHDWHFISGSTTQNDRTGLVLMAVCRRCGLIRTEALRPHTEHRISLSGTCEAASTTASARPTAIRAA